MNVMLNKEEVEYLTDLLPDRRENAGADNDPHTFDLIDGILDKLGWQEPPHPRVRALQEGQWELVLDILRGYQAQMAKDQDSRMVETMNEILDRLEED